jgi:hypothetical protein
MILARIKAKASNHYYYLRRWGSFIAWAYSIYQAVSGDIIYIPQDFDPEEHICFEVASSCSTTGSRTNDELGYPRLTTVFDCETKAKGRSKTTQRESDFFEIPNKSPQAITRAPIMYSLRQ